MVCSLSQTVARLVKADRDGFAYHRSPLLITLLTFDSTLLVDLDDVDSHRSTIQTCCRQLLPLWSDNRVCVEVILLKTTSPVSEGDPQLHTRASQSESLLQAIQAEFESIDSQQRKQNPLLGSQGALALTVLDHCAITYQKLVRGWMQPLLPVHSLRLDLPDVEGVKCSLQLSASYQTMPFATNSQDFQRLKVDLQELSLLEVVKTLNFTSLDLSLMYGIPITVRADMQDDFESTQQLQSLFRSLLRYLLQRQSVLLVKCADSPYLPESRSESGLFGGRQNNSFVLLPQQVASGSAYSGLLFRYARASQLVESTLEVSSHPDDATADEYQSYFEDALDSLQSSDNPLDEQVLKASMGSDLGEGLEVQTDTRDVLHGTDDDDWVTDHRFWDNEDNQVQNDDMNASDNDVDGDDDDSANHVASSSPSKDKDADGDDMHRDNVIASEQRVSLKETSDDASVAEVEIDCD